MILFADYWSGSKLAKFTDEPYLTDNAPDYFHKININRVSLWDWQGKIARQASQIEL
ncbi:hypothetical protein [Flavobacterium hydatis]|uniref:hypothetical protein n=1 Tax=Flavobacterium hydatis TaxID=991 RepID=UPI000AFB5539|nr:hypothetical protein [Flavobacterium hydatis]